MVWTGSRSGLSPGMVCTGPKIPLGTDAHLPVSHLIPCRKGIIIFILSPNASVRTREV